METKTEIIKEYEYIVVRIASQYERVGEPMEDMMQDGRIGLLWAAEHYQKNWKKSFESYAAGCVRHEICASLKEHGYTVKVPRRVAEETDHHPVIGLSECKEIASEEEGIGRSAELGNRAEGREIYGAEDEKGSRYERLYAAIDQLTEKQQVVIRELYGLEGRKRKDVKRLAREMGIEACSIYDMQERTLAKLKRMLTDKK